MKRIIFGEFRCPECGVLVRRIETSRLLGSWVEPCCHQLDKQQVWIMEHDPWAIYLEPISDAS